ncbi:DUF6090 family protein [Croceivirga thetidis]|uniref:Uncharacterized protein n=1 Tax=Croceivirga thetidis TaxID=2721623 RepID=A0ABX1GMY8_9FLAO|nr:DUF6090 family protein [Croceivirga thetidis]NKI30934.1 hypothetical protein [Croceivirga thetidis]
MIKFFRRFRQNLLQENRFSKYLLYAIGEIVLVVVGILIALQINNWNEKQKTVQFEQKLSTELIQSLQSDIKGMRFVIKENREIMQQASVIIELIEGQRTYHDSLSTYIFNAHEYYHHSFDKSAYETSRTHGLYFIKNDSTRKQLSDLYEWQYEHNSNLRPIRNDFYSSTVEPFLAENFALELTENKGLIPHNPEDLIKNPKYKFIIMSSISKTRTTLYWQNKFLENMETIKKRLKSEF